MKKILLLSGLFLLGISHPLRAQHADADTISRNVMVESVYNPVLASSEKRAFLPLEQPAVEHKEPIVYAYTTQTASGYDRLPIRLDGVQFKDGKVHRGSARLGGGNRLNVDAAASYLFKLGGNDGLGVDLGWEGWNGSLPYGGNSWKSRRNDMRLRADYSHVGTTSCTAGAYMGRHVFNYILADSAAVPEFDVQKAINYGAYAAIDGVVSDLHINIPLGYTIDVAIDQWQNSYMPGLLNRNSESCLKANLGLHYDTRDKGTLCLGVNNSYLRYTGLENYHSTYFLNLHPAWCKKGKIWAASLGMNVDLQSSLHRIIQASPDLHFSFIPFKIMQISLMADGGRTLSTFGDLYTLSPYWSAKTQPIQSYTRLHARAQVDARLAEGLHISAWGGCRFVADDLTVCRDTTNSLLTVGLCNTDTRATYAGASLTYVWKDQFRLGATWQKEMWKADIPSLVAWKPDMELNVSTRVRLEERLHVNAALHCLRYTAVDDVREAAVADVSIGAEFRACEYATVWVKGDNLLGRSYSLSPVYPSQGIRGMLGITARF